MTDESSEIKNSKLEIIAIDGPSGVGKTTIAENLSKQIGVGWLSSGALYRAVTRLVIDQLGVPFLSGKLVTLVKKTQWHIEGNSVMINEVDVTSFLNSTEVDSIVAEVSSIVEIREYVSCLLHSRIKGERWIVEGRDIGTEVFPGAILKIFLNAMPKVRAGRRLQERGLKDYPQRGAEVAESLARRDRYDRQKPVGWLRPADEAHMIDTTYLTIAEVCDTLVGLVPSHFFLE